MPERLETEDIRERHSYLGVERLETEDIRERHSYLGVDQELNGWLVVRIVLREKMAEENLVGIQDIQNENGSLKIEEEKKELDVLVYNLLSYFSWKQFQSYFWNGIRCQVSGFSQEI